MRAGPSKGVSALTYINRGILIPFDDKSVFLSSKHKRGTKESGNEKPPRTRHDILMKMNTILCTAKSQSENTMADASVKSLAPICECCKHSFNSPARFQVPT